MGCWDKLKWRGGPGPEASRGEESGRSIAKLKNKVWRGSCGGGATERVGVPRISRCSQSSGRTWQEAGWGVGTHRVGGLSL